MFHEVMLQAQTIIPQLPDKTVALTFDDGPGDNTLELARWLAAEGVLCTFFCLGKNVRQRLSVVREMHTLGHLIGNHTYMHSDLVKMIENSAKFEVLCGDAIVRDVCKLVYAKPVLFRAPYGNWNAELAACFTSKKYKNNMIGPIGWNIPKIGGDWWCWRSGWSPEDCADALFKEIKYNGGGVVDLHDWAPEPEDAEINRTPEMVRLLVPRLRGAGFKFVKLDEACGRM